MSRALLTLAVLAAALPGTASPQARVSPRTVTFLHFNDVYEITPVAGGSSGGLARVATMRAGLRRALRGVVTTLGGDFLSPSALGLAIVDSQRLAGRQMVAVLNQVGVDWAVLGNHEFDIREHEFRQRLAESRFRYVATNVSDSSGALFPGTARYAIARIRTAGGVVRLGLIGLTIDDNRQPWVRYADPVPSARAAVRAMADSVDAIVALTHLTLDQDQLLVESVPEIDLVLGGHEHENYAIRRGARFTPIVKADANVRTVAVVTLTIPRRGGRAVVTPRFVPIDTTIREDPVTAREVARWVSAAEAGYRAQGLDPRAPVTTVPEPLDGREAVVRTRAGNLTDLIADALRREVPDAAVGIMNGGSVRIDDVIPAGVITQYDVIRVLPFGGDVVRTTMSGALLMRVLDQGVTNRGSGGFLHASGVRREGAQWLVGEAPISPGATYVVATTDFLLTGRERGLDYLAPGTPGLGPVTTRRDIRLVVIDELRRRYPAP